MYKKTLVLMAIVLLLQACSGGGAPSEAVEQPQVEATDAPVIPTETVQPVQEATSVAEEIVHTIIPSAGTTTRATAHDNDNSLTFETKKVQGGDDLLREKYERPFTAQTMDYLPDIDIVDFSITSDDKFFYITISFVGVDPQTNTLTGFYGVQFDANNDGRSEIMLATRPEYTSEFSPDNIALFFDSDGDIGGNNVTRPDNFPSDGYDTVVFDLSQNIFPENDPDLAWVRATTEGGKPAIEIAYRKWLFKDGNERFLWNVLASDSPIDPRAIYFHDHFTPEQAGSPNTDSGFYPLNELAGFDNTCRVPLGFTASGSEPMGCFVQGPEFVAEVSPAGDVANAGGEVSSESAGCGGFESACGRFVQTAPSEPFTDR